MNCTCCELSRNFLHLTDELCVKFSFLVGGSKIYCALLALLPLCLCAITFMTSFADNSRCQNFSQLETNLQRWNSCCRCCVLKSVSVSYFSWENKVFNTSWLFSERWAYSQPTERFQTIFNLWGLWACFTQMWSGEVKLCFYSCSCEFLKTSLREIKVKMFAFKFTRFWKHNFSGMWVNFGQQLCCLFTSCTETSFLCKAVFILIIFKTRFTSALILTLEPWL